MVLRQISQQLFLQLPFLVILLLQSTSAGAYPRLSPSWLYALALFCSFAVVALPNNRDSANHVLVGLKENKHDSATPFAPQGFFRQQDILAVDVSKNTTSSQRTPSHDNRLHSSKFLTNLTFMEIGQSPTQIKNLYPSMDILNNGLYPRLIGIGCQKCGTTSLAAYLSFLEGFVMSPQKELHAFSGRIQPNSQQKTAMKLAHQFEWYGNKWINAGFSIKCNPTSLECYGNASHSDVPFEITPRYLSDFHRPYNMWQMLPSPRQVKFVAILRNPVPRVWSAYHHVTSPLHRKTADFIKIVHEEVRLLHACYNQTLAMLSSDISAKGFVDLSRCKPVQESYNSFHKCIKANASDPTRPWFVRFTHNFDPQMNKAAFLQAKYMGLVYVGIYGDQLFNYICAGFRPEQILILTSSELRIDPIAVTKRIADFVGVPFHIKNYKWFRKGIHNNKKSQGNMPQTVANQLIEFYKPHNDALIQMLQRLPFRVDIDHILSEFGFTP